jgi:ribosome-binding factor A
VSRRTEQLASILHQAVQSVIQEGLADPRAIGMATVTSIRVTDDLSQAIISVSILPEKSESLYMHALEDAAAYIRRKAGDRVSMHRLPSLIFKLDRTAKRQAALLTALAEVANDPPVPVSTPKPSHPTDPSPEEPTP